MYRCLNGEGSIDIEPVPEREAALAAKGWYFLMGNMALTRFRSQKRTAPGSTEDLDTAIVYLAQDLEHDSEKWETWLRLAQAYDSMIEDSVTWSAEKLNNEMTEIVQLQRSALHLSLIHI